MMKDDDNTNDLVLTVDVDEKGDQLPSVEEYKTTAGYRKQGSLVSALKQSSLRSLTSLSSNRPDPVGTSSSHLYTYDPEDSRVDDERDGLTKDLESGPTKPRVVQAGASTAWKIFAISSFLLLVFVIVVGVTVSNKNKRAVEQKEANRYQDVTQYLINMGVSKSADFDDNNSAQHKAAHWLANEDGMHLDIPDLFSGKYSLTFIERYVLAVFYYSTGGPNWTYQLNWLTGTHPCAWYDAFVADSNVAALDGDYVALGVHGCKQVDDELVPISIFLPNVGLVGTIPEELAFLDRMMIVDLQFNAGLTGTLPDALSEMDSLVHLALQWCSLTGTIPTWVGRLTNLSYIGLGNNHLTGTVPEEMSKLTSLQLLGLDDNQLAANIELFSPLTRIKSLYLENNNITGTISEALMVSWPSLQELDLSSNQLSGSLPVSFFDNRNYLEVLDLSKNNFKGLLPVPSADNTVLEVLAVFENGFDGGIPEDLQKFKALRHLDLSYNQFSSWLPSTLGSMTKLEYLFVGDNALEPSAVPPFLIQLTNLRELSLKNCRLEGPFPDFLEYLKALEFLDLHFNHLTGTIPANIGKLTNLKHLLLKSNLLTGTLPNGMGHLSNLAILLLEQNKLTGDAGMICGNLDFHLDYFVSDCSDGFKCSCCNLCCEGVDSVCNPYDWDGNLDPIWEYGYRRGRYSYDLGPEVVNVP